MDNHYIIFSDLHLCQANLRSAKRVLVQILTYARENRANVIFLGDFFHAKGRIDGKIHFETLIDNFDILSDYRDVKITMIPGNHDFIIHEKLSIDLFKKFDNVRLIKKPTLIQMGDEFYGFFIPYCKSRDEFLEILETSSQKHLCFAHVGVVGALGLYIDDEVSPEVFKDWKYVFLGHYHIPQKIGKNIEFIGSALQNSWADACQNEVKQRKFIHLVINNAIRIKRVVINEPIYLVCDSDKIPDNIPKGSKIRINVVDRDINQDSIQEKLIHDGMDKVDFFYQEKVKVETRSKLNVGMSPVDVLKTYLLEEDLQGFEEEELWETIEKYLRVNNDSI